MAVKTDRYDALKLENQLCFPLYAASREITKKYTPFLKKIGLTYTQYVAMMVLWEINILINLLWGWCVITINNYHRELDKYIAILNIQLNNNIYCKTVFSCHSCMSAYKNGRQQLVVVMIKYFF
jgi:hypothetical protein